jgi:hypothetical protein
MLRIQPTFRNSPPRLGEKHENAAFEATFGSAWKKLKKEEATVIRMD